jgi:hypothetical protein
MPTIQFSPPAAVAALLTTTLLGCDLDFNTGLSVCDPLGPAYGVEGTWEGILLGETLSLTLIDECVSFNSYGDPPFRRIRGTWTWERLPGFVFPDARTIEGWRDSVELGLRPDYLTIVDHLGGAPGGMIPEYPTLTLTRPVDNARTVGGVVDGAWESSSHSGQDYARFRSESVSLSRR